MERLFIAAASWELVVDEDELSGVATRDFSFAYCNAKMKGPGIYRQKVLEPADEYTEANLVVITLILMERKGMIVSAEDVYKGAEKIKIDDSKFESAEALVKKLKAATISLRQRQHILLEEATNRNDEDDSDDEEEEVDGDSGVAYLFAELVKNQDKPGDAIPWFTQYEQGRPISARAFNPQSKTLHDWVSKYGYRPDKNNRFGVTGARKHFRQDSRNPHNHGVDMTAHFNQTMGHSTAVAHRHYDNAADYQNRIAGNMFSSTMDQGRVRASLENSRVTPAFKVTGFFKKDWPVQTEPLPSPVEFIRKLAKPPRELVFGEECHVVGCNKCFHFTGDLIVHMRTHKKAKFKCPCGNWEKDEPVDMKQYQSHLSRICKLKLKHSLVSEVDNSKNNKLLPPPPGVAAVYCSICEQWFFNKRGVDKHQNKAKGCKGMNGTTLECLPPQQSRQPPPATASRQESRQPPPATASRQESRKAPPASSTASRQESRKAPPASSTASRRPPRSAPPAPRAPPTASRRPPRSAPPAPRAPPTAPPGRGRPQCDSVNESMTDARGAPRRRIQNNAVLEQPFALVDTDDDEENEFEF
jgi:hypothetical protein